MAAKIGQRANYRGLSLLWMRVLLGRDEPKSASAAAMAERYREQMHVVPEIGDVLFYDASPAGDVALCVGIDQGRVHVLCLDGYGRPVVRQHYAGAEGYVGAMRWPER